MGRYTEKTSITRGEYVTLTGLLAIADRHRRELDLIASEVAGIIGETEEHGHADDAVYCSYSVDELLRKSEMVVEPSPTPSAVENLSVGDGTAKEQA